MSATYQYSLFSFTPATENGKWLYLLPSVAVGAAGAACIPHFALGLGIGVCQHIISNTLIFILNKFMSFTDTDMDAMYRNQVRKSIMETTLLAPLGEELLFRGVLQSLLIVMMGALLSLSLTEIFSGTTVNILSGLFLCQQLGLLHLALLAILIAVICLNFTQLLSVAMFGAGINAISLGALGVTAILFGALHLRNDHSGAPVQAFISTLNGIAWGLLALQYGLWGPVGAHMMNNTLAMTHLFLADEFSVQEQAAVMPRNMCSR